MFRLAALLLLTSQPVSANGGIRSGEVNRELVVGCISESFEVAECTLDAIRNGAPTCSDSELAGYLDVAEADLEEAVENMCHAAMDAHTEGFVPFEYILMEGKWMDREYFDGHTKYNEQVQTRINTGGFGGGFDTQSLRMDAARIDRIHNNAQLGAQNHGIEWPTYIPNFVDTDGTCEHQAAMCCWVQDRQANDGNGNCRDDDEDDAADDNVVDYDTFCKDKDPADNTEICYVDMARSPLSNHVAGGYAIFDGENLEGDTHCHGMAWPKDEYDDRRRYLGNNIFYISMYDHLETRGYTRNVPGAPMCGCMSQMPVVERSDCTQMDITETFEISLVNSELTAKITEVDIEFNACQGKDADGNDDNNDLESYARVLFGEDSQELQSLQEHLVGDNNCQEAIDEFLETQLTSVKLDGTKTEFHESEGDQICFSFNKANPNRNDQLLLYKVEPDAEDTLLETIYTTGTDSRVNDSPGVVSGTICYGDGSAWRSWGSRILFPGEYRAAFRENVGGGKTLIRAKSEIFTVVQDHFGVSVDHGVYYEGLPVPINFEDGGHRMNNYIACYTSDVADQIPIGEYSDRDEFGPSIAWVYSQCPSTSWNCWSDNTEMIPEGTLAIPSDGWSHNLRDPYRDLNRYLKPGVYKCFYREVGSTDSYVWAASDRFAVLPASSLAEATMMSLNVTDPSGNEFALSEDGEYDYSLEEYGVTGDEVELSVEAVMYPTVVKKVVFSGRWGRDENAYPYSLNGDDRDSDGVYTLRTRTFELGKAYEINAIGYDSASQVIGEKSIVLNIVP